MTDAEITALLDKGLAHHKAGRLNEAGQFYDQALEAAPDNPEALHLSGLLRLHGGKPDVAVDLLTKAVAADGSCAKYHSNLGAALMGLGRAEEALSAFQQAESLDPDDADYAFNQGDALIRLKRPDEAITAFQRAIAINPNFEEAQNNLGLLLKAKGETDAGIQALRSATKANTDSARAQFNLARGLAAEGRDDEALAAFKDAAALAPDNRVYLAAAVDYQLRVCDWSAIGASAKAMVQQTEQALLDDERPGETPLLALTLTSDAHRSRRVAEAWAKAVTPGLGDDEAAEARFDFKGRETQEGPLTLGYLLPEPDAACLNVLRACLPHHDPAITRPLVIGSQKVVQSLKNLSFDSLTLDGLDDAAAAQAIYAKGVDVLVDMLGFQPGCRPGIMTRRPAPVAIGWPAFQGSIGAAYMDYALTDPVTVSDIIGNAYSEHLCRMPKCFAPALDNRPVTTPAPSRTDLGLPAEALVLAAWQPANLLDRSLLSLWAEIMAELPDTVLWLSDGGNLAKANLRREAQGLGIAPDRLIFAPKFETEADQLAALSQADLALDGLWVNDWGFALDSLSVALPIITMTGDDAASRTTSALLKAMSLGNLCTVTKQAYKARALELLSAPDRLDALKEQITQGRDSGRYLFDNKAFTADFDRALDTIWQHHQSGRRPIHLTIHDIGKD